MHIETDLTRAIRAKAKEQGLNQGQLAKRIGVVQSAMVLVLRGVSQPNSATIKKYARFLELPPKKVKAMVGKQHPKTRLAAVESVPAPVIQRTSPTSAKDLSLRDALALVDDPLAWAVHRAPEEIKRVLRQIMMMS